MSVKTGAFTEETVEVAGHQVQVRRGGQGAPLLVLHGELWIPGWTTLLSELCESREVIVPSLPGFGQSQIPEWVMGIDDLAVWVVEFTEAQQLPQPVDVLGLSLGGWAAAVAAAANRRLFRKMVLSNPIGVKPADGDEMWDYNRWTAKEAFAQAVSDQSAPDYQAYYAGEWSPEGTEQIEVNRDTAARLTWKPYMWSYTTRYRAELITTPTLVVVSSGDRIVPNSCGRILHKAIRGSQLAVIPDAGHLAEIEAPHALTELTTKFLAD